jgi:hypothetical protein
MLSDFEPKANTSIRLFGEEHVVQPHPEVSHLPYSQEAGRAVVHQLVNQQGQYFAFKVFKDKHRNRALLDAIQKLKCVENYAGLRVAQRRVVKPSDPAAQRYRNLAYAMLMPWINGNTWFDILLKAETNGTYLHDCFDIRRSTAIRLCNRFLEIMAGLETNNVAHTDIAAGNVMVNLDPIDVQLIDVEDIYMPDWAPPLVLNKGSDGYRHLSGDEGETTWKAEGDRYSAAVLAAEMIVLTNQELASETTADGFFRENRGSPLGVEQYKEARGWLEKTAPGFAKVFERCWFAESLQGCPKISELRIPIKELANSIPQKSIQSVPQESTQTVDIPPLLPPPKGTVEWMEPDATGSYNGGDPKGEVTPPSEGPVRWHRSVDSLPEPEDEDTAPEHDHPVIKLVMFIGKLVVFLALTLFVLLVLIVILSSW